MADVNTTNNINEFLAGMSGSRGTSKSTILGLKTRQLTQDLSATVLENQIYLTNAAKYAIQVDQIKQVNSWLELERDIENKKIVEQTGRLVGAQTSAYGYAGVSMSGSALDVELQTLKEGALAQIYNNINTGLQIINNEYQAELQNRAAKTTKRIATSQAISSVDSSVSSFAGGR